MLQAFLSPFEKPRHDIDNAKGAQNYPQVLLKLCESALKFTLMTRSCKDAFDFRMPDIGVSLDTDLVSAQEYLTVDRPGGETIAFTLSPALIKLPEHNRTAELVLDKAHVVVHRGYDFACF